MFTRVKTASELEAMRESGQMLATVLGAVRGYAAAGMSTKDVARKAADELKRLGGEPAFLGQYGFPDVICISLNEEVVHGIPSKHKIIHEGDILSLDFGVKYRGMITDSAISVIVGKPRSPRHQTLLTYTERSLMAGIGVVRDNVRTGDIGAAVQAVLQPKGYGIVRDLVGHGVGHELHEEPNVPNYGRPNTGARLSAGMTIAIEPMATLGSERVAMAGNDFTVVTADGSWSAHFEHSVAITEDGAEILTAT
jgi:methionyl aminopeptidase